ncbi:MAG: efflux RND transporter periplasmic adaptor subunit [Clostridia bacterium]|nr:efflux RND transporter periplasmic adaptor subunit [Clostridia bacterium]
MSATIRKSISITIFILAAAILFSGCSSTNSLQLSGSVESTQIDANSEVAGKILHLEKDEGAAVKKDDVLASIDASAQELIVKQHEATVKAKQARLDELKAGTRTEQIRQAEASTDTAKTAVNSAKTSVDNAQINYNYWVDKYNKTKSLNQSGAASDNDLQDARYKMDTANQQLITAQKQLSSSQSQLQSAQAQLDLLRNGNTNQTIKAAEADLEQSQAVLEQAKLTLSKYQVKSPIDGTYLLRNVETGDIVNAGTGVATISDLSDLWVKVYIPQRHLNSIKLGQELELKTVSLPGQTIKGKITFISSDAEFTPKNTETSEAKENTVFKVKIKMLDHIDQLKPGMTVDAHIPLGGK